MKTPFQIIAIIICFVPLCTLISQADDSVLPDLHIQEGDRYFFNNQYLTAVDEYEQAVHNGVNDSEIFRKLSFLYYHLGFLDKAQGAAEKAVFLSPDSELLRMELGVIYFAKNAHDEAKEQFISAVKKNPGLTNGYYYLGEIFYRNKNYAMAWMFAKRSRCLGHRGRSLIAKLSAVSEEPAEDMCVYTGTDLYIRQILVSTDRRAEEAVKRIEAGELFEDIAMEEDMNKKLNIGGYLGKFAPSELHPNIVQALQRNKAFSAPVIVETESGFHIIQQIAPFDIAYGKATIAPPAGHTEKPSKKIEDGMGKKDFSGAIAVEDRNPSFSDDKAPYIVYAGSYRQEQHAVESVNELRKLGYQSYHYEETTESKGTYYVVVAGKYKTFDKAKAAGEDITKHGFDYYIHKKR